MTAGSGGSRAVAGGPAPHIPVLGRPALDLLNIRDGGIYIDATFGAGGYSARHPADRRLARVIAIDRDPSAIALGSRWWQPRGPVDAGRGPVLQSR